ncbi:MAG: antitoxin [Microthrixaceae bacterium]
MGLDDLANKAKALAEEHADKVDDGIDKAAEFIDEKTGGKFSDKIDQGAEKLKDILPGGDGGAS